MITNITRPGLQPANGDLIRITHQNGASEERQYWEPVAPPAPDPVRVISRVQFLKRFTQKERIAIRTAAKVNDVVHDYLTLLDSTTGDVHLDDAFTSSGLDALEAAGLIGVGRASAIKNYGLSIASWVEGYIPGPDAQCKYVAKTGSDTNPGTSALPFLTVQKAVVSAQPGDTIIVGDGTYTEVIYINNLRSGSVGKYVTLRAQNPGKALLREADGEYGIIKFTRGVSYWRIEGFDIPADRGAGISGVADAAKDYRYHHIQIVNNTIHNCGDAGIGLINCDYVLIECNTVVGNAKLSKFQVSGISLYQGRAFDDAPGYHIIIQNNRVFDNTETDATGIAQNMRSDGNGIIFDDFRNEQDTFNHVEVGEYLPASLCAKNICGNNGGAGISVFSSNNVTVIDNTCYNNSNDVQGGEITTAF